MVARLEAATTRQEPVYDSAHRPGAGELVRRAWRHRQLVLLLTRRDLRARYGRASVGAAWGLLTPLVYAAALYAVFSRVPRFATAGVPFAVYVLSGVVVLTAVTQAILSVAGAVVANSVSLRRSHAPVGVFAAAAGLAALSSLAFGLVALLIVQVVSGAGIPATALLLPLPCIGLAAAAAGVGLAVGAVGAAFPDALEGSRVAVTLLGFMTPVFYPVSILSDSVRSLVDLNPLYRYLLAFRDLAYGNQLPDLVTAVACVAITALCLGVGALTLDRVRHALPSTI
jgi:ABC-type polysaccharide/polyol phosphate export permease